MDSNRAPQKQYAFLGNLAMTTIFDNGSCDFISFSPPARWGLLDFITVVLLLLLLLLLVLLLLLHHLCLHFHGHFRLANSSPTSARSGHCWTSTAGFRSEWARLDLNRQVLSAVCTVGPQRPDRMPEDMPDRTPDRMSDRMPEGMPEDMSDRMSEDFPVTKRKNVMVGITRSTVIIKPFNLKMCIYHSKDARQHLVGK